MSGKSVRMRCLTGVDGRSLIVPVDHAVTYGPIKGLVRPRETLAEVCEGGLDAVVMHRGLLTRGINLPPEVGVILHLSGATSMSSDPGDKRLVATVEDAIRLGAVGVSFHITFGSAMESNSLADLGSVSSACLEWGIPLLVMVYSDVSNDAKTLAHCARVASELGADLVKVPRLNTAEELAEVIEGCDVPILTAGSDASIEDLIETAKHVVAVGGGGLCVGRTVFQADNPRLAVSRLRRALSGLAELDHSKQEHISTSSTTMPQGSQPQ